MWFYILPSLIGIFYLYKATKKHSTPELKIQITIPVLYDTDKNIIISLSTFFIPRFLIVTFPRNLSSAPPEFSYFE